METAEYYSEKGKEYYSYFREDVFAVIKKNCQYSRVLEIGCSNGALLNELKKEQPHLYTVGVDPFVSQLEGSNIDVFLKGTIDQTFEAIKAQGKFDLIIFADVLEHLEDPWTVLKKVVDTFLMDNGSVVVSIPNFRNLFTLSKIIFTNSFKYQEQGVLDKTHLRFFCRKDIVQLAEQAGLEKDFINPSFKFKKSEFFKWRVSKK